MYAIEECQGCGKKTKKVFGVGDYIVGNAGVCEKCQGRKMIILIYGEKASNRRGAQDRLAIRVSRLRELRIVLLLARQPSVLTVLREFQTSYRGASVLTEKNLIFVDYSGATRGVVDLDDIVSASISPMARGRLVVSYGRNMNTNILEFESNSTRVAERTAQDWYDAVKPSSREPPVLIARMQPSIP